MAHWRLAGQPAERKQSAIWIMHSATAISQVGLSENTGRGLEHQSPHPYSQVGAGAVDVHLLAEEVDDVREVLLVIDGAVYKLDWELGVLDEAEELFWLCESIVLERWVVMLEGGELWELELVVAMVDVALDAAVVFEGNFDDVDDTLELVEI